MGSVLVLGNYRQTLIVVRSLSRAGHRIVLGRENGRGKHLCDYSRHVSEFWHHADPGKCEGSFIEELIGYLRRRKNISHVFPVGEAQIVCLLRNYERLSDIVRIVMPDPKCVEICLSKRKSVELAKGAGVPVPGTEIVTNLRDLELAAERLGFPCIIKPDDSRRSFPCKAVIARSIRDIRETFPCWQAGNDLLVVQRFHSGIRHNGYFVSRRGELAVYYEHQVVRTDRADGTGLGVENITVKPTRELLEHTRTLVSALEYNGVGCAQFLRGVEPDSIVFLELNPRLGANCAVPFRCGVDLPLHALECADEISRHSINLSGSYPEGILGYWTTRDIEILKAEARSGNLSKGVIWKRITHILKNSIAADCHMTWSLSDPLPAMMYLTGKTFSFMRKRVHMSSNG